MKFCLSSRQSPSYLEKADEIKIDFRDRQQVYDLAEQYKSKVFILKIQPEEQIDWAELKKMSKYCYTVNNNDLILCLSTIGQIEQACFCELDSYYGFPISSFFEYDGLCDIYFKADMPLKYVLIAAPLTHMIDRVNIMKKSGTKIRMVPNVVSLDQWPHINSLVGSWVRPEDVETYETVVDVFEFEDCDLKKEQALYRIYAEEKTWPGELSTLISGFNYPGLNRMIGPALLNYRANCAQKCLYGGTCNRCKWAFDLANPELILQYTDHKEA